MLLAQKMLLNFQLDLEWLIAGPGGALGRLAYTVRKYVAILRDRRRIDFLGKPFGYDNRLMPALLPGYWAEVAELNSLVPLKHVRSVLDVGANVGQFAAVLKEFNPDLAIYSFEPNPEAFALLSGNAEAHAAWTCHRFGIGEAPGTLKFYFVNGKSAQGSLSRANAMQGLLATDVREISVDIRPLDAETRRSLSIPDRVDLIKIDVEGAERSALEGLRGIEWKYLYMEMSNSRDGGLTTEEALAILNGTAGSRVSVKYREAPKANSGTYQVLLESAP